MARTTTPRIYVACLASYNAGRLHGRWIDVGTTEELREEVAAMLEASPTPGAEEWAIHDYQGFHGLELDEFEGLERVAELAGVLEEYGPAYAAYAANVGPEHATPEEFEEAYRGEWESEREFSQQLAEDLGYLAGIEGNPLAYHIDWDSWARELFCGNFWSAPASAGRVWVFASI